MDIQCKNCRYEYDFKRYGEACPQCGFENKPFRSQSARRMMGYQDDSFRSRYFDNARAERREALLRAGDPDYGKSPLRRIRKYLFLVALCCGVLILGNSLQGLSRVMRSSDASYEKPAISDLASAAIDRNFQSVDGVQLRVKYVGTVPDDLLGTRQRGKELCVFVDVWAVPDGPVPERFPGTFFVRVGEDPYPSRSPASDGADMRDYTSFRYRDLWENGRAAGQFFFYVPMDTETFFLCWQDVSTNTEQRMELHI